METIAISDGSSLSFFWLLGIGISVFALLLLVLTSFFGVATETFLKKKNGLIALLLLSLLTPLFVGIIQQRTEQNAQAQHAAKIQNTQFAELDDTKLLINFDTDRPAVGFLVVEKDGTSTPVLPAYPLQERSSHSIAVDQALVTDAKVYIVINGKRFLVERDF